MAERWANVSDGVKILAFGRLARLVAAAREVAAEIEPDFDGEDAGAIRNAAGLLKLAAMTLDERNPLRRKGADGG